jgi:hypothetical protein
MSKGRHDVDRQAKQRTQKVHARTTRHIHLAIGSQRRLGPIAIVVLCVAVIFVGNPVMSLCIEDDGMVIVESILRLCCTQHPQHPSDGSCRVASPCRDSCRDLFITIEGTTESSNGAWAPTDDSARSHVSQVDNSAGMLRPQLRPKEVASAGPTNMSLKCLQSVRLLT